MNLDASCIDSIVWSTGETSLNILVSNPGMYSVTIIDFYGDTLSDSITVYSSLPTVTILPDGPTTFCDGDEVVLTGATNPAYYFTWSTGVHTHTLTVSASGLYVLTVTNSQGCSNLDSITVTVLPLPNPVITENGNELCTGVYSSYQWRLNNDTISGATDSCYYASQSGLYDVMVSDQNNCFGTSSEFSHVATSIDNTISEKDLRIFPNPLSTSTTISFSPSLQEGPYGQLENVSLKIFDVTGRLAKTLANGTMSAGNHPLQWNATDENGNAVSEGVYFLKMQTANESETLRLSVVK